MPGLHILHVSCYSEHAWAYGGIPRVLSAQSRALVRRGHRVTVATTDAWAESRLPAGVADRDSPAGLTVRVFPNLSNTLARRSQLYLPLGMRRFLDRRAGDFDVAHLHGFRNLPGAWATAAMKRAGVPIVLQPNGTAPRIERRRLAKLIFDAVTGRADLRDATRVIAVSAAERRQLNELGVAPGLTADIPNPVDLADFAELPTPGAFRATFGLDQKPVILYLGQLGPRKRIDLAVQALATLDDDHTRLVIAGPDMGAEKGLHRLVAELGLEARCFFTGVLEGRERLQALVDADVVVYPSQHEIFGLVPLEALLCSTPVVVSDDCGCGEVITRTGGGLVVEHGSPDALAVAVAAILEAPARWREPVAEAAGRITELYSAETVAEQLEDLYRSLVADRESRP